MPVVATFRMYHQPEMAAVIQSVAKTCFHAVLRLYKSKKNTGGTAVQKQALVKSPSPRATPISTAYRIFGAPVAIRSPIQISSEKNSMESGSLLTRAALLANQGMIATTAAHPRAREPHRKPAKQIAKVSGTAKDAINTPIHRNTSTCDNKLELFRTLRTGAMSQ